MQKMTVKKWGNSDAVILPQHVKKRLGIKTGDVLDFDSDDEQIVIKKPKIKQLTAKEIMANYQGGTFKSEVEDFGKPKGNEVW